MIEVLMNVTGYQRFEHSPLASTGLRVIHSKHRPSFLVIATHHFTQRRACHHVEHHMYWL